MNRRNHIRRLYALLAALMILFVHGGQAVHIFTEDLRHFAAFCGTEGADSAASDNSGLSEECFLCNFHFCSCLAAETPLRLHCTAPLVRILYETAHDGRTADCTAASLRAPPALRA